MILRKATKGFFGRRRNDSSEDDEMIADEMIADEMILRKTTEDIADMHFL